jgi:hypothetical protein
MMIDILSIVKQSAVNNLLKSLIRDKCGFDQSGFPVNFANTNGSSWEFLKQ